MDCFFFKWPHRSFAVEACFSLFLMKWRYFRINRTNLHDQSSSFDMTFEPSLWVAACHAVTSIPQCLHPKPLLWLCLRHWSGDIFCLFTPQSIYLPHSCEKMWCVPAMFAPQRTDIINSDERGRRRRHLGRSS